MQRNAHLHNPEGQLFASVGGEEEVVSTVKPAGPIESEETRFRWQQKNRDRALCRRRLRWSLHLAFNFPAANIITAVWVLDSF